MLNLAQKGVKA